ncbi:hypothetical protein LTR37_013445 [Vermiconidia calcicola]|uniref:Uncharacterized protein n=1 Tax=Vermiconidia calcicola TaxID=1690605 RepID=A0ACC3MWC6_9PEZI|nr:hypothetical protein LTR37_013445 [Vermiconidia calcicola]
MSTFNGKVEEFPDIRIDYFRLSDSQARAPLAYFLSHVHSDHLNGLESCKSPFIYCSPATRDILLRLEKYPHRMNFAKGILETRRQTYRHLKTLLKAIPLETPTVIDLAPGHKIRVTLFDANHCVGAVMFLIEGDGKAVVYTGDIRSELWWVNSLARHPLLLPYVCRSETKPTKILDSLYIDTTFVVTGREDPYKQFPSKAEGIHELLSKVAQYPTDTHFYFDSWTFGYEDVWQALSNCLGAQVHVDDYRYGIYRALANGSEPKAPETVKLMGFHCGNHFQEGCLTSGQCRIHSCEKGTGCEIWNKDFVRITPIISRHNGMEMAELGAGGGQGDLNQQHDLEVSDTGLVGQLMALCAAKLQGQPQLLSSVLQMLTDTINERTQYIGLDDSNITTNSDKMVGDEDVSTDLDELPLEKLVPALARLVTKAKQKKVQAVDHSKTRLSIESAKRPDGLPKRITFPYSRHSSYEELCFLVEAFKPRNIHPCTVDETNWAPSSSMNFLFGHIYDLPPSFRHDQLMLSRRGFSSASSTKQVRPASSGSETSRYGTPSGASPDEKASPEPGPVWEGQQPSGATRFGKLVQETGVSDNRKRKRPSRYQHGDYWPPRAPPDIDHYAPPSSESFRVEKIPASTAPTLRNNEVVGTKVWPDLSQIEITARSPVQDRWLRRIAEATTPQISDEPRRPVRRDRQSRELPEYGRLTPPTTLNNGRGVAPVESLDRVPADLKKSSQKRHFTGASESTPRKMALRHEAYDAVLGRGEYTWSDIGLASVNGHQLKEEEL